jgi:hypothetical protein
MSAFSDSPLGSDVAASSEMSRRIHIPYGENVLEMFVDCF